MAFSVVALVVALTAAAASAQFCTHTTVDVDTGATLRFLNLSKIAPLNPDLDIRVDEALNSNFYYYFRVCDTLKETAACPTNITGSSVCQVSAAIPSYDSLGVLGTMVILDFPGSDRSRGVTIEYSDGSFCSDGVNRRRTTIIAECEPNGNTPISSISAYNHPPESSEPCNYQISLRSVHACPEPDEGVCIGITDCASCSKVTNCGWCSLTQQCTPGDPFGPASGSCFGPYWHYNVSYNPCIDCPSIGGCAPCSSQPDCKFCATTNTCQGITSINCQGETICTCPTCGSGSYCPDSGGQCIALPNTAGLFVGGLFLGLGLVAIGGAIYYFWSKRQEKYTGLA